MSNENPQYEGFNSPPTQPILPPPSGKRYENAMGHPYHEDPQTGHIVPGEPPKPQNKSKWHVLGYIATAVVAMGIGSASTDSNPTIVATAPTITATATVEAPPVTETVQATNPAKTVTVTAQPPAPKVAFGPGSWLVGEDIKPGKYKTAEEVSEGCYWEITRGANGDDIVANQFVTETGGIQRVTLKKGQQFDSNECGDWVATK